MVYINMSNKSNNNVETNITEDNSDIQKLLLNIGLNISHYRKLRGLSQLQLAEMVNISRTYMSNIEAPNTEASPSIPVLYRIATCLDVDIARLFEVHL